MTTGPLHLPSSRPNRANLAVGSKRSSLLSSRLLSSHCPDHRVLLFFHIPSNGAGLAAQTVCSGTFVSGRNAEDVFTEDVLPQSPASPWCRHQPIRQGRTVTAKFLGIVERRASSCRTVGAC